MIRLKEGKLYFKVKLSWDKNWKELSIHLSSLEKENFTCDESLSMDIMECVYALDNRFFEYEGDLVFNVGSYWEEIVLATHKSIYGVTEFTQGEGV